MERKNALDDAPTTSQAGTRDISCRTARVFRVETKVTLEPEMQW